MSPDPSPLSRLARELEEATDAFTTAEHECALLENEYHRVWSIAYTEAEAQGIGSVSACERVADGEAHDEKALWRLAEAAVKSTDRKWKSIDKRLSAAQSYYRMVERQT